MKFRVKATNETLPVAPDSLICGLRPDGNEVEFSVNDVELISDDWSAFRREVVKDILVGIIANSFTEDMWTYQQMADMAIEQADELIKQLKEK